MASVMMAVPTCSVASTSTGPVTFGSTCENMIAKWLAADDARGLHVFLVALHQRGAAHRAGVLHPAGRGDGEDQHVHRQLVVHALRQRNARDTVDQQRDQDGREGQLNVGHAHDERIDRAADVAGDQSQRDADQHRQHHGADTDQAATRANRT